MKHLIGDKKFYGNVLKVAVPIMIQNGISNFVSLLDNIMIGQVGTEQMSGIAIVNQLLFVFYLGIFGALSAAGIFSAQFYGKGDHEGVRHALRFKLYITIGIVLLGIIAFLAFGDQLILLYLHDEGGTTQSLDAALRYGREYLAVMLIGLLPFGLEEAYASTLRECGETTLPMLAGIAAVFVNLGLNYVLIFGHFGFPALGVTGAAIATVIARYLQMLIVVGWTHTHVKRVPFAAGLYQSLRIPAKLVGRITVKGFPLMANEIIWAAGMAVMNQCYSLRGLDAVAGLNIASTITNLFNTVFIAMGSAVSIMVGQLLGAGKMEEAKDTDAKLIAFSVFSCVGIGSVLMVLAPLFPMIYNTTEQVRALATGFIRIGAGCMPIYAFMHASYFTLRSGGKTLITFCFDSLFLWVVSTPAAYVLSRYTALPVLTLYLAVQLLDLIKCAIGFVLVKKGVWLQNIVAKE
ncbi:MAG: MATE family efflux transporter [Lachnospiraceae bacterium]|nr:MATE family efflux transporter [Lachnospiraceae bacterium]MBQ2101849.1 MATE family efflux transporter [Lachnospiraceae bacterium]